MSTAIRTFMSASTFVSAENGARFDEISPADPTGSIDLMSRIRAGWAAYRHWRRQRLDAESLHWMNDRMLRDIGVTRFDIHQVSRNPRDSW